MASSNSLPGARSKSRTLRGAAGSELESASHALGANCRERQRSGDIYTPLARALGLLVRVLCERSY